MLWVSCTSGWLRNWPSAKKHKGNECLLALQLLKIGKEQKVAAMLPVHTFTGDDFVLMLTRKGLLKRCRLSAFAKINSPGKTAISLVSQVCRCFELFKGTMLSPSLPAY